MSCIYILWVDVQLWSKSWPVKFKLDSWLILLSNLLCWRFQTIKGTNNPQYFFLFCFTIPPGTCKEAKASRAGSHYLYKLNNPNTEKIPAQRWLEPHATCSLDTCHGNHTLTLQNIKKSAYNLICIYTQQALLTVCNLTNYKLGETLTLDDQLLWQSSLETLTVEFDMGILPTNSMSVTYNPFCALKYFCIL